MDNEYLKTIYATALPTMASHGFEDTIPNRIAFLTGMLDAWKEDTSSSHEKSMYMMVLAFEILKLTQIQAYSK